jgi:photosystem II stability/assembly factor-like uncharacterized protein
MSEPVELRDRLERLARRGEDRGPEWLIASVNRSLTEPAPSVEPARRPGRRPLITVAFAFAAVAAVVLIVLAFGPRSHSSPSPATRPTATTVPVSTFDNQPAFLSANEGWLCHDPLEYTTDRGVTWRRIGLGAPGLVTTELCAFAAGGDAWVAMPAQPPNLTPSVARVVAGAHPTVTAVALPGAESNASFESISFADPLHGWVLTTVLDGKSNPASALYGTTDGGVHWRRIATTVPVTYGLRFTSPTTGWGLTLTTLERTDDAGLTWRTVPTASTPTVRNNLRGEFRSVSVFGHRIVVAGILPTGRLQELFVEVSNDDGAHWSLQLVASKVAAPPFANPWEFVAVDADHWRYVDETSLASTDNADKTWHVQPNRVGFVTPPAAKAAVSFVTPDIAWAVQCPAAKCLAVVTVDNGKTWSLIP